MQLLSLFLVGIQHPIHKLIRYQCVISAVSAHIDGAPAPVCQPCPLFVIDGAVQAHSQIITDDAAANRRFPGGWRDISHPSDSEQCSQGVNYFHKIMADMR